MSCQQLFCYMLLVAVDSFPNDHGESFLGMVSLEAWAKCHWLNSEVGCSISICGSQSNKTSSYNTLCVQGLEIVQMIFRCVAIDRSILPKKLSHNSCTRTRFGGGW
ncbi:hypothetical protein EI94DRAFT_866240 [Lactarius quietus]|nr:hypothetical protein EI94DRAFT_866240 [Lactarius quietus]